MLSQKTQGIKRFANTEAHIWRLCRQMAVAMAEAEKLRAAGDAYKRELLQAKLAEREAELNSTQDKLRAAKREINGTVIPCMHDIVAGHIPVPHGIFAFCMLYTASVNRARSLFSSWQEV